MRRQMVTTMYNIVFNRTLNCPVSKQLEEKNFEDCQIGRGVGLAHLGSQRIFFNQLGKHRVP